LNYLLEENPDKEQEASSMGYCIDIFENDRLRLLGDRVKE